MNKDYYAVLGIAKGAGADEIKKAYRKLAIKFHPDKNPGNKQAEERFKEITEAYAVLSDPEKRRQYDQFGQADFGQRYSREDIFRDVDMGDLFREFGFGGGDDLFASLFGGGRRGGVFHGGGRPRALKGADYVLRLALPLRQALLGGERRVSFERDGQAESLQVRIPPGVEEGQRLRVPGKGGPSPTGGPPGDLFLELEIEPDPLFTRDGRDLLVTVNVPFSTLCLGGSADVPTLDGNKRIKIPAGMASGGRIRLKGFGAATHGREAAGDLYAVIVPVVPRTLTHEQRELLQRLHDAGL